MNKKYYIADEDGFEFRVFDCKEYTNEFLKLRPECKINRIVEEKPLSYSKMLEIVGECPY